MKVLLLWIEKQEHLDEGYVPPIHDFTMENGGEDITELLMAKEKLMLVVAYNLKLTSSNGNARSIKKLSERAMEKGYTVYCFSASTQEDYEKVKEEFNLDFDLLFCDETTLKTIVRSNPGILILDKGTITGKWSWRQMKQYKLRLIKVKQALLVFLGGGLGSVARYWLSLKIK